MHRAGRQIISGNSILPPRDFQISVLRRHLIYGHCISNVKIFQQSWHMLSCHLFFLPSSPSVNSWLFLCLWARECYKMGRELCLSPLQCRPCVNSAAEPCEHCSALCCYLLADKRHCDAPLRFQLPTRYVLIVCLQRVSSSKSQNMFSTHPNSPTILSFKKRCFQRIESCWRKSFVVVSCYVRRSSAQKSLPWWCSNYINNIFFLILIL